MAVIYCFGDSITYGAWDVEGSGWVARLRKHLDELQNKDESLYFLTHNLGIPGDTTDGLTKRFSQEFNARDDEAKNDERTVFIFAFGANDSVFMPGKNEFRVPKERFISNLQGVIDEARKVSDKIILLNITPCDEKICADRYEGKDKLRSNRNVEEYNNHIKDIAKDSGAELVDACSAYLTGDYREKLSEDGLHPNEKGHELIFEKVKNVLLKTMISKTV